jgi:TPR repeat protein
MKRVLATLILVLLPAIASANDFDAGWVAYKKGDYEAAFEAWLSLAKSGDAQSQTAVGSLYYLGLGVRHDHAEARRLYLLAAEQGFASALFNLGIFYSNPDDEQNVVEAYKWFILAAEKGMQEGNWRQARLAEKMTAAQIAEAESLAKAWREAHPQ